MGLFTDRRRPVLLVPAAEEDASLRIRVWLLGIFALMLFAVLTVQLVRLQIFRHEEFEALATINRIRNENLPAERGLIFDRNGNALVENVPAFAISVIPADIPDGEEAALAQRLGSALGISPFEVEAEILAGKRSIDPFFPRVLETNAEPELAFELSAQRATLAGCADRGRGQPSLRGERPAGAHPGLRRPDQPGTSSPSWRRTATASRTASARRAWRRPTSRCCAACPAVANSK